MTHASTERELTREVETGMPNERDKAVVLVEAAGMGLHPVAVALVVVAEVEVEVKVEVEEAEQAIPAWVVLVVEMESVEAHRTLRDEASHAEDLKSAFERMLHHSSRACSPFWGPRRMVEKGRSLMPCQKSDIQRHDFEYLQLLKREGTFPLQSHGFPEMLCLLLGELGDQYLSPAEEPFQARSKRLQQTKSWHERAPLRRS